jgi:hypothetical protein
MELTWQRQSESQEQSELYESSIHKATINLTKFAKFLKSECGDDFRNQILMTSHVSPHRMAIQMIANEFDMWSATPPPVLATYRQHYFSSYAAFPSNTQMAESSIKGANFCQIPGRNEKTSSVYATARAGLVGTISQNSVETFRAQEQIKGNQYTSSGKHGARTSKSDATEVKEKDWKMRVSGKIRSEEAIKLIVSRSNKIESLPDEKKKQWKTLRAAIDDAEQQFAIKRVEAKFEGYCETYGKNKAPNKLQRQAGEADVMPIVDDRIPYGLLLKERDTNQIMMELAYRGLSTDGGWHDHLQK